MESPQCSDLLAAGKLSGSPLIDVAGAYFPAWLVCVLAGLLGTWLISSLIGRSRFAAVLLPAPLMLPSLFLILCCGTWLLLFSAR